MRRQAMRGSGSMHSACSWIYDSHHATMHIARAHAVRRQNRLQRDMRSASRAGDLRGGAEQRGSCSCVRSPWLGKVPEGGRSSSRRNCALQGGIAPVDSALRGATPESRAGSPANEGSFMVNLIQYAKNSSTRTRASIPFLAHESIKTSTNRQFLSLSRTGLRTP